MSATIRLLRPQFFAAVALMFTTGCGVSISTPTADPGEAQKTLHAALDAWKAGEKPEDLKKRATPIHIQDVDWGNGLRLVSYKADGDGKLMGFDMNYSVLLELTTPRGKAVKKNAVYTISTHPELLVLRHDG
jgi:hypothetical protein